MQRPPQQQPGPTGTPGPPAGHAQHAGRAAAAAGAQAPAARAPPGSAAAWRLPRRRPAAWRGCLRGRRGQVEQGDADGAGGAGWGDREAPLPASAALTAMKHAAAASKWCSASPGRRNTVLGRENHAPSPIDLGRKNHAPSPIVLSRESRAPVQAGKAGCGRAGQGRHLARMPTAPRAQRPPGPQPHAWLPRRPARRGAGRTALLGRGRRGGVGVWREEQTVVGPVPVHVPADSRSRCMPATCAG